LQVNSVIVVYVSCKVPTTICVETVSEEMYFEFTDII